MRHPEVLEGTRRLRWLVRIAAAWALLLTLSLIYLQIFSRSEYQQIADRQHYQTIPLPAQRGVITDRNGRPLAMDVPAERCVLNAKRIRDEQLYAELLGRVLRLPPEKVAARIRWGRQHRRGNLILKENLASAESDAVRNLKLEWAAIERLTARVYPKRMLAANLVGAVYRNNIGRSGIELSLEAELQGRPGRMVVLRDARQRPVRTISAEEPVAGKTIGLTIDERIQHVADQALAKAARTHNAKLGSIIVLDPKTGDLLAVANYPTFDPAEPLENKHAEADRLNRAVSSPFEPGSVFKIVPVAAALDLGIVKPTDVINCGNGKINVYGQIIHDLHKYGSLTVEDALVKSSNVCAIQIALLVKENPLHQFVHAFGFGERTSAGMPGESAGRVRPLSRWKKHSIGYVAMGHEVSATPIQLAQACAVIANGGIRIRPRAVLWRQSAGQKREMTPVSPPMPVLKPETAITMRQMMEQVVLRGTGKAARLHGYSSGGKTGSAQVFDFATRRYTNRNNASFVGFAPVANPAIVVVVSLNGVSKLAGVTAAPVFAEVAGPALRLLGVLPDLPQEQMPEVGHSPERAFADQSVPPPPAEAIQPEEIEHEAAVVPACGALLGPKVPDFQGMSLREVIRQSAHLGIPVDLRGEGLAWSQSPRAGTILAVGQKVRVEFTR